MKKILLLCFLFSSLFGGAYFWLIPHPGYAPKVNAYGNLYNRLIADSAVHIPNKSCICTLDNDTTPQLFIYADTLRGFWNGTFKNIGFGSGGGSGIDTIFVTSIGTGSPQVQLLYAVNGNLRSARLVKGLFTTPVMNSDSGVAVNLDTAGSAGIAYKLWIIAQYGPGVGGNLYTINGTLLGDRILSGSSTHSLTFDSLFLFQVNAQGYILNALSPGNTTSWNMDAASSTISISDNPLTRSSTQTHTLDSISFIVKNSTGSHSSALKVTADSILFRQLGGIYYFYNIPAANDSALNKPIAFNTATKTIRVMDGWPGGGGGGASPVVQTITAGPTVTINNSTDILQVNNTTLIASLTVTLPTTWPTNKVVKICFTANGTITSGNTMVTSITIVNGSGQTLSQSVNPNGTSAAAGENLVYGLIGTVDQRLQ